MQIRVSVKSLFFAIYTIIMFMPSYFSNSFVLLLNNLCFLAAIIYLVLVKYKPSSFTAWTFVYFMYLTAISFVNKTDMADYHLIISTLKTVVYIASIDWMVKKKPRAVMNIFFCVLFFFVVLDFLSLVFFPNGLYQSELVWNQWSTSYSPQWIYGNKNNRIYWYIMLLFVVSWKYKNTPNNRFKGLVYLTILISIIAILLSASSTSICAIILAVFGVWIGDIKRKQVKFNINPYFMLGCYLVLVVVIVGGFATFLSPIVSGIFGKDLTFTNRTNIWRQVLLLIMQKPILGHGYITSESSAEILGSLTFTSAHNQLLNTLWQGGICLLIVIGMIMMSIAKRILMLDGNNNKIMITMLFFGILLVMVFETILSVEATWVLLFLFYLSPKLMSNKNEENLSGGSI